jgi:hypothetical protein
MDEYLRVVARGSDYMNENDVASGVFDDYDPLECVVCHKDLLKGGQGNVVFVRPFGALGSVTKFVAVYAACKDKCDRAAAAAYRERECSTGMWAELEDLVHPQGFMSWDTALMNQLYAKREDYSPEAFETLKEIKLKISQKVYRQHTTKERDMYLEDQRWRDLGLS